MPSGDFQFYAAYPLIPWVGVMAAGYVFGPVLQLDGPRRLNWLLSLGRPNSWLLRATGR